MVSLSLLSCVRVTTAVWLHFCMREGRSELASPRPRTKCEQRICSLTLVCGAGRAAGSTTTAAAAAATTPRGGGGGKKRGGGGGGGRAGGGGGGGNDNHTGGGGGPNHKPSIALAATATNTTSASSEFLLRRRSILYHETKHQGYGPGFDFSASPHKHKQQPQSPPQQQQQSPSAKPHLSVRVASPQPERTNANDERPAGFGSPLSNGHGSPLGARSLMMPPSPLHAMTASTAAEKLGALYDPFDELDAHELSLAEASNGVTHTDWLPYNCNNCE